MDVPTHPPTPPIPNLPETKDDANKKDSKPPSKSYTIISNTALILWGIFLAVVGIQAVNDKASNIILNSLNLHHSNTTTDTPLPSTNPTTTDTPLPSTNPTTPDTPPTSTEATNICENVPDELTKFINNRYRGKEEALIPPIATVIDLLQVNDNWREPSKLGGDGNIVLSCQHYHTLFSTVAARLDSIVAISPMKSEPEILSIKSNLVPKDFRPKGAKDVDYEKDVKMPIEVGLWVQRSQRKNQEIKNATSFLDLFVLLIILGGFGSWVYLIRLHLLSNRDNNDLVPLKEYFYRPVLGMSLAIAVFIVNLSVHSVLSNSEIDNVRQETLILLAFTAGLLSDKTYEFIEKIAQKNVTEEQELDKEKSKGKLMRRRNNKPKVISNSKLS